MKHFSLFILLMIGYVTTLKAQHNFNTQLIPCEMNISSALRETLCPNCITLSEALSVVIPDEYENPSGEFQNGILFDILKNTLLDPDFMDKYGIERYEFQFAIHYGTDTDYWVDWMGASVVDNGNSINLEIMTKDYLMHFLSWSKTCNDNKEIAGMIIPYCKAGGKIGIPIAFFMDDKEGVDDLVNIEWDTHSSINLLLDPLGTGIVAVSEELIAGKLLSGTPSCGNNLGCWKQYLIDELYCNGND